MKKKKKKIKVWSLLSVTWNGETRRGDEVWTADFNCYLLIQEPSCVLGCEHIFCFSLACKCNGAMKHQLTWQLTPAAGGSQLFFVSFSFLFCISFSHLRHTSPLTACQAQTSQQGCSKSSCFQVTMVATIYLLHKITSNHVQKLCLSIPLTPPLYHVSPLQPDGACTGFVGSTFTCCRLRLHCMAALGQPAGAQQCLVSEYVPGEE